MVGDIQGCFEALQCLLKKIDFEPGRDTLYSVGDLVNRGPNNLETLRLLKALDARVVLGNHDLHLLALYYGSGPAQPRRKDTLADVLAAPDREALMAWLRSQPLCRWLPERNIVLSHAGLPHIWHLEQALALAREVETVLCSDQAQAYFDAMYGNEPAGWSDDLSGMARLRVITNYFTRMRFINDRGDLELTMKETVDKAPSGFAPWFDFVPQHTARVVFGHWAALGGHTGRAHALAVDTGCVWGGALTAMDLDTLERVACDC